MGFLGGGTGSASSSITNSLVFNPNYVIGNENRSDTSARQEATSTASATAKDEFGMSASVGVLGGTGGTAELSRSGDTQPMATAQQKGGISSNTALYAIGGGVVVLGGFYFMNKKKRK